MDKLSPACEHTVPFSRAELLIRTIAETNMALWTFGMPGQLWQTPGRQPVEMNILGEIAVFTKEWVLFSIKYTTGDRRKCSLFTVEQCLSQDWEIFQFTSYQFFFYSYQNKRPVIFAGLLGRQNAKESTQISSLRIPLLICKQMRKIYTTSNIIIYIYSPKCSSCLQLLNK